MNYSLLHVSKCYSHDFMTIHDSFEHICTNIYMYIYKINRYHYLSKNEGMMFGMQTISWQLPYFNQGKYKIFLLDSLSRPF